MERAVLQITLFGLLLSLVSAQPIKSDWDIYSFHINSTVTSRYATTLITSRVANRMDVSKEIEFQVRIPKNAFISKFRMFIDGQEYNGTVKAKEEAQQQYTGAVSRGESAGIVSSVGRTLEEFKTSVNVAAHKKVTFELTYEELLKRTLGKYELQIHARPMQPVKDFKVDVYIHEKSGINFINVKGGLSKMANAITTQHVDKQAWVYFYPTEDQQKTCEGCGAQGMNGDLIVVYEVNRDVKLGDIMTSDGYFVHHFAPSDLTRIPKNVVFVIDQSGSMNGRKIHQTRIALRHILSDLAEDDFFGLVTFDSVLFHWKRELVQASQTNLDNAKKFVNNIRDRGATDINKAVLEGARMLNANSREGAASILILLTDGDPTSGVTNIEAIQANVRQAIADKFPLYCLGFGFDVNFEFLKKMSLQSNGVARRIYEDSDADLQLKGFYEEVATPLLTDVTMVYMGGTNLTQTNFSQYYNGSEIVVAGLITDNNLEAFVPQVVAISGTKRMMFSDTNTTLESTGTVSDVRIQRVWAYLTVKQLLEKQLQLSGAEQEKVKKEALELSLKYGFVTPLTSMVVTKPPGESTDVLHKPKEGQLRPQVPSARNGLALPGLSGRKGQRGQIGSAPPGQPGLPGLPGQSSSPGLSVDHLSVAGDMSMFNAYGSMDTDDDSAFLMPIAHDAYDFDMDDLQATISSHVPHTTAVPSSHRFLLKTQSLPLCFDVTGDARLKLLHYSSRELYVNGELDSTFNGGFTKIIIHFSADQHVEINTSEIIVREGNKTSHHTGEDPITAGGVTVIKRNKEVDVAAGDVRLVILLHEKDGNTFLWPAIRQQPADNALAHGILGLNATVYEEVQQTPGTKLKINNQVFDVTRSSAVDYSIASPPTLGCWLVSAATALQRPLDDFIVMQL
ncbi:inter alpha-trypsin inhibitor, heavy chain 4 isoform X2 [Solea solea]|uniref:inter alpha-trypsin inhibitor, heavy chain 4 isoform X2 n=1 Tax=Solea solea TaxID=90069 RepID=UPI0027298E44|nr:inter alpha-trypsin inhibitor, heavy chain 4 isoform X2 [Solea solea]